MEQFLIWLDPWLIFPYRVQLHSELAFILGTAALAVQCVLLGLASMEIGFRLHAKRLEKWQDKMQHYHVLSEQALGAGDKESYKAVNKQAQHAFGHHFSLGGALFIVSIWPVPIALAWMALRFQEIGPTLPFSLPLLGKSPGMVFWFLLCYIPLRMLCNRVKIALLNKLSTH